MQTKIVKYWNNVFNPIYNLLAQSLDQNTLVIIQNEFIKMFPSRDKVAPEIYDPIEKKLQIKISTFKS